MRGWIAIGLLWLGWAATLLAATPLGLPPSKLAKLQGEALWNGPSMEVVPGEANGALELDLPAAAPGTRRILLFSARMALRAGYQYYLTVRLNGHPLDGQTLSGAPRLLNRKPAFVVTPSQGEPLPAKPHWGVRDGTPALNVFMRRLEKLDMKVTDEEEGFTYALDVSDLLSEAGKATLEFENLALNLLDGEEVPEIRITHLALFEVEGERVEKWLQEEGLGVTGPFSFRALGEGPLQVFWGEEPLVISDGIEALGEEGFLRPEGTDLQQQGPMAIANVWKTGQPHGKITYRREVAAWSGGVEVNAQFRVPAYHATPEDRDHFYHFRVPIRRLEGASYSALSSADGKVTSGVISSSLPEGGLAGNVRMISFTLPEGRPLLFDLNPAGPVVFNRYGGPTALQGGWQIHKKGEHLHFRFGYPKALSFPHYGVFLGQCRITEESLEEGRSAHAHQHYSYYSELPAVVRLNAAGQADAGPWKALGIERRQRGFAGWIDPNGIRRVGKGGVLQSRLEGEGRHELVLDLPFPGLYVFTVRTRAEDQPLGPFSILGVGEIAVEKGEVAPGEVMTWSFTRWVDRPEAVSVVFEGAWAVSSLAVQPLLHEKEDVSFRRGVWLAEELPAPTSLYRFPRRPPPSLAVSEKVSDRLTPRGPLEGASVPPGRVLPADPLDEATAWRWSGTIPSLGPDNNGSFYEFESQEQIERRLDELAKLGHRAVLVNGMHFRLSWPDQHERLKTTLASIVRAAHERGIKVVEHFDLSVVPYHGAAYQVMVENLQWTLRDVRRGEISRGYCLNRPAFRDFFFPYLQQWVEETGIDGLMLDEVTFHTEAFCGCHDCRTLFYRDTGQVLPLDEEDPDLLNPQSRLWKLWLAWRNKAVGDWFVDMLEAVRVKRPDFVLMNYAAPIGFTTSLFTQGRGGNMSDAARANHFLGTEVMSRNVYANYRANLALRAIFNSLRYAFSVPMFALVYPEGEPVFAYAGWAQNQMHAQLTWTLQGSTAIASDASRYVRWSGGMDVRAAKPVAEVAVLFSERSRDFSSRSLWVTEELIGVCEQLDDHHVPYQVLLERDLTRERLAPFTLLIVPGSPALSDGEIAAIRQYLEEGGRVWATGDALREDALGFPRAKWPFGEWLGLDGGEEIAGEVNLQGAFIGGATLRHRLPLRPASLAPAPAPGLEILARTEPGGEVAMAVAPVGKGELLWSAPWLGRANYEQELTHAHRSTYQPDPEAMRLFGAALERISPKARSLRPLSIPTGVRLTHYQQSDASGVPTTFVHLYNGTGATLPYGEPAPLKPPVVAFPPVSGEIAFEIRLASAQGRFEADFVSPDFEGSRPVTLQALGGDLYRVSLPGKTLEAYGMVRIRPVLAPAEG